MALESDEKFEEKLAFCFKNDMTDLVNFNASSHKLKICNVGVNLHCGVNVGIG